MKHYLSAFFAVCSSFLSFQLTAFPVAGAEAKSTTGHEAGLGRQNATLPSNVWLSYDDLRELPHPEYEPRFKLFPDARVAQINKEHIRIDEGDVLVRASTLPVFISAVINGERIIVRVARNTMAFVSTAHGSMRIMPLTETCCSALLLYVPGDGKHKQSSFALQSGKIAEVFPLGQEPLSSKLLSGEEATRGTAGRKCEFIIASCDELEAVRSLGLTPYLKGADEIFSRRIADFLKSQ